MPTIYMILHIISPSDASHTYDLLTKFEQLIKEKTQGGELAIDLNDNLIFEIIQSGKRPFLKITE